MTGGWYIARGKAHWFPFGSPVTEMWAPMQRMSMCSRRFVAGSRWREVTIGSVPDVEFCRQCAAAVEAEHGHG